MTDPSGSVISFLAFTLAAGRGKLQFVIWYVTHGGSRGADLEWGRSRRSFLTLSGVLSLGFPQLLCEALAMGSEPAPSLLSAPLELSGNWKSSPADAVLRVLTRMREVSLEGVKLLSDRQPDKIRVDSHESGTPAIWLHDDHSRMAWIIVDIGTDDWSKLSYQFGHELGHVLCNSWNEKSQPHFPCQWLEESMVEAFSIRGLGRLATSWETQSSFSRGFSVRRRNPEVPRGSAQEVWKRRRTEDRPRNRRVVPRNPRRP